MKTATRRSWLIRRLVAVLATILLGGAGIVPGRRRQILPGIGRRRLKQLFSCLASSVDLVTIIGIVR